MSRTRPFLRIAAVLLVLATSTTGLVPATAREQNSAAAADPALAPAVASGRVPATAWAATGPAGTNRIYAAVPAGAPGVPIGPPRRGNDGAPTMVARGDEFIVVASRRSTNGARLWSQRWSSGRWLQARMIEPTAIDNHHPALASGNGQVWLTWVASDPQWPHETVYAARWTGAGWSTAEALPATIGTPMAPSIATDSRGRPAVVWAASDGTDAEIWFSRRRQGSWSLPVGVSDNQEPDILPHIAFVDSRPVVAWAESGAAGYLPVVATGRRAGGDWSAPHRLSLQPGSSPKVFAALSGPGVVWTAHRSGQTVLVASTRASAGWSPATELTRTHSGRLAAATSSRRGTLTLAWPERDRAVTAEARELDTGRGAGAESRFRLQAPEPTAAVGPSPNKPRTPTLTGKYRAFGDSITLGLIRVDGEISILPGYPVALAGLLSGLLGRTVTVENRGFGGELTSEGVGRLNGLMATAPTAYTFLLEGSNDVANLIDAATTAANLVRMVDTVKGAGSLPIISTVLPRTDGNFKGGLNPRIDALNAALLESLGARRAVRVDQHAVFFKQASLYSDQLHPNEAGYDVMAEVWFRGIRPILQQLLADEETDTDRVDDQTRAALVRRRHPGQ